MDAYPKIMGPWAESLAFGERSIGVQWFTILFAHCIPSQRLYSSVNEKYEN